MAQTAGDLLEKNPARLIENAIKRMLPKGPLAYGMITKLKIYTGPEHPHVAQTPVAYQLKY